MVAVDKAGTVPFHSALDGAVECDRIYGQPERLRSFLGESIADG
jgi:hypothetical protein